MRIHSSIGIAFLALSLFCEIALATGPAPKKNNNVNRLLQWVQPVWVDLRMNELLGRKKPGDGSGDASNSSWRRLEPSGTDKAPLRRDSGGEGGRRVAAAG